MQHGLVWWREYLGWTFGLSALVWIISGLVGFGFYVFFKVYWPIKLEDEARRAAKPKQVEEIIQVHAASGELLELYGWRALAYQVFKDDAAPDLTRELAEKQVHIPQRAYNKLNEIFVAMQIKTPKAWVKYEDTYPLYLFERVSFDPNGGGAWVDRKHIVFKE